MTKSKQALKAAAMTGSQLADSAGSSQGEISDISDLDVQEVSIVDSGAIKKKFFLLKEKEQSMEDLIKAIHEIDLENEDKLEELAKAAELTQPAMAAVKAAMRAIQAYRDEIPSDFLKEMAILAGAEIEAHKGEVEMEKKDIEKTETVEKIDDKNGENKEAIEALMKAHACEVEELRKQLNETRDQMQKDRLYKEAEGYCVPGMSTDEIVDILHKSDDETASVLRKSFAASTKAMGDSKLFVEIGKAGDDEVKTGQSKIEKLAAELRKADPSLSEAQAIRKAVNQDRGSFVEALSE